MRGRQEDTENMQLIEDCEKRESKLSDWERNFLDDIKNKLVNDCCSLSMKQEDRLNEIWCRVTA